MANSEQMTGACDHCPVLLNEVMEVLEVRCDGRYIDATLGGGGHAEALLAKLGPDGRLLGLDRDDETRRQTADRLQAHHANFYSEHGSFADIEALAHHAGFDEVDGVLFDLGISSIQLDNPERGFSFNSTGPLDMRMDRSEGPTAADLVNRLPEAELADLFYKLGDERGSRRIARAVVKAREQEPFQTAARLAAVVEAIQPRRGKRIHPATKVFMALRIAVNRELEALQDGLDGALQLLRVGGRLAVISFHSIEDRIVKQFIRSHVGRDESLQEGGTRWVGLPPRLVPVGRRSMTASDHEIKLNPRARSARLRAAEKAA